MPLPRVVFSLGLAGVFALALSAVQWLPSLEAARRSARAGLGPEARAYWSVHPLALLQLVFPVLVDTPGLGSVREQISQRTIDFTSAEELAPADAVVYLLRNWHAVDSEFLLGFRVN